MKTKSHNSVLYFINVFFYIKMNFLANILENILQKLSEYISNNLNLKQNKTKQNTTPWETYSADKLELLEPPPRIVVAPAV